MSLKKEMTRDEHGYINNRGASKYWGVTTSVVNGKKTWVVSHGPKWSAKTKGHQANGFTLKEVDAARIAAYFYEQSQYADECPPAQYIRSADGKHLFAVDPMWSLIGRIKNTGNIKFYEYNPTVTLSEMVELELKRVEEFFDEPAITKEEARKENHQILMMLETLEEQPGTVMNDRELIALVTEAVLSKSLTKTGAKILIGVLDQVVYS